MKRSRWLLLGMAAVLLAGMFASPVGAAETLTFVTQPANAVRGQTITTVHLDLTDGTVDGSFIQVLTAPNRRVNLTSVPASSLNKTVLSDGAGLATFTDISISAPGLYTLKATTTPTVPPATSNQFKIFDAGEACDSSTPLCDPITGSLGNRGMTAKAAGTSSDNGVIGVSLNIESAPVCPGDDPALYNHGPSVVSAFWEHIDSEVVITLTISKAWDQDQPQNGAAFYQVCFTYDIVGKTFKDKFGNTVEVGLLPDCGPRQGPPCVQSRTKDQKGNVKIVIRSLTDPKIR